MKRVFPPSFYSPVTLAGTAVAAISFGLILFLMLLETLATTQKPYMGIVAFVILPVFLILGLAIMVLGIWREHRRLRTGVSHGAHLPVIDLNNPRHLRAFIAFSLGTVLLLIFSAFGSYQAYEATDSTAFCGETCHAVMSPQYTAYQYSPHARVGCVQCHIGPGADWFVRSKISGTYQVYATLFNKYPRPIPTPIQNLRPAQETCEQCHWPKQFYSEKKHLNTYYLSDEDNTRWGLNILIKIGGGNIEAGPTSGIHWHMNIANEITYAPMDSTRQVIPWVRSRRTDGTEVVYRSTTDPLTEEELSGKEKRRMDCVDCHNRPSHIYHPPARSVNRLMSLGWINPKLPGVKAVAVEALEQPYSTKEGALDTIEQRIAGYYRSAYPAVADSMGPEIERVVREVQRVYSRNYFPEMGVSWRRIPDNIGHLYYPGCFRCHDDNHVSDDGKILSRNCNECHLFLAEKIGDAPERVSLSGLNYQHPVDIGDAWMTVNCSDCHNAQ